MGYIGEEIEEVSTRIKIKYHMIPVDEATIIKQKLAVNFSNAPDSPKLVSWQNLVNFDSHHDPAGWRKIAIFRPEEPALLFVNPELESCLWYFPSGKLLVEMLGESIGFPFCVTSLAADYLICFDDSDCLIATGAAKVWLEQLKPTFRTSQN
jgi:hypothetical protein